MGPDEVTHDEQLHLDLHSFQIPLPKCASVLGPLKIINFPFVPNGKFIIFRCPKIWAHYSLIIMYLNIGTPNNHRFSFGTNGKVVVLVVPILKHFSFLAL